MRDGTLGALNVDGRVIFRLGREGDVLIADWIGIGILRAHESGSWAEFLPAPGVSLPRVQKLRDGPVRGLLRHLHGGLAFHGASVALNGAALILVGESGAGKSTLAAHLCLRDPVAFVADDATLVDDTGAVPMVLPSGESHWLWPDSRQVLGMSPEGAPSPKESFSPRARLDRPVRVAALVELAFDDALLHPVLEQVVGARKFGVHRASVYRFLVDSDARNLADFAALARFAERTPTFVLRRPKHFAGLGGIGHRLLDLIASSHPEDGSNDGS